CWLAFGKAATLGALPGPGPAVKRAKHKTNNRLGAVKISCCLGVGFHDRKLLEGQISRWRCCRNQSRSVPEYPRGAEGVLPTFRRQACFQQPGQDAHLWRGLQALR